MTEEEKMEIAVKLAAEAEADTGAEEFAEALLKGDCHDTASVQSALAAINALAPRLEQAEALLREVGDFLLSGESQDQNQQQSIAYSISAFLNQGKPS